MSDRRVRLSADVYEAVKQLAGKTGMKEGKVISRILSDSMGIETAIKNIDFYTNQKKPTETSDTTIDITINVRNMNPEELFRILAIFRHKG